MGRRNRKSNLISVLTVVSILFLCIFSGRAVLAESGSEEGSLQDEALSNLIEGWPYMESIGEATGLVIDADNGGVIYSLNRDAIRYPASTTKVLTALLVLENASLDDIVTMTDTGVQMAISGSSNCQSAVGEQFTVEQCLYILLLKSANDIANQLAEHVGGTLEHFVEMMNERARELGCTNTHFTNPSGMPDPEHYTTAEDLARIMQAAVKNETFLKIAGTEKVTIPPTNTHAESRTYVNHNALLISDGEYYYPYCIAGKTGYTDSAWRTYVSAARKDDRTLICVLMKGPDKTDFSDAAELFEYGFNEFSKIEVPGGSINLPNGYTVDDTGDDTMDMADGTKRVTFYFDRLPVGKAVMTQQQYAELRHLSLPAPAEEEKTEEETAQPARDKSGNGGWIGIVVIVLLAAAILTGAFLLYRDYMEKKRRRERRKRALERKRAREQGTQGKDSK